MACNRLKLFSIILFIIFIYAFVIFAEPIDLKTAENTAYNWLNRQLELKDIHQDIFIMDHSFFHHEGINAFYFFNFYPEGWVIVSSNDSAYPIIGYNTKGRINPDYMNCNTRAFLAMHADALIEIIKHNIPNDDTIKEWNAILEKRFENNAPAKSVGPLLQTKWNQNNPWNNMCPPDSEGPGGHAYAGCVAVAMAQNMRYWEYPSQGTGSNSYYHNNYGIISADFGNTEYNWSSMPNNYASQATQLILFHAGVSVYMNYGPNGSGAMSSYVPTAIVSHFSYDPSAVYISRQSYTDNTWKNILKHELNHGRPVYYRGDGGTSGGHAFNCDGYDHNDLFHFNWGWGGWQDGYYNIDSLNPGHFDFTHNQAAIVNFFPAVLEEDGIPVYRFFNTVRGGHLYTISEYERDTVMELEEWNYEGISYKVHNSQEPGTLPAYRFFNTITGIHLYTISEYERDAVKQLPEWNYEGTGFYVYEDQLNDTIPVFRFFNTVRGGHLYTISEHERDNVLELEEWSYEGISFYVIAPEKRYSTANTFHLIKDRYTPDKN